MIRGLVWFGLGAGLMYFTDPRLGRRRRAQLLDQANHLRSAERSLVGKARRDLAHRLSGFVRKVRPGVDVSDDQVIAERVRAAIGRVVSHPHAIDVEVRGGSVALRGPILSDEAQHALRAAAVRGVTEVLDRLERHREAGNISALQGTPNRTVSRGEWPPAIRLVAAGAGVALAASGVRRSVLAEVVGSALVVRAIANRPLRQVFGVGDRLDVRLDKTITIHAPTDQVYDLAKRIDSLPKFLEHVRRVQIQDGNRERSHWVVDGPFGREICFDAKVTSSDRDRVLAWTSDPDEPLPHCGVIHFEPVIAGTRVHIQMHYAPRGGLVGHLVARALGFDPRSRMNEDLVRMKSLLEDGRTHAHHQLVTRDSLGV
jgi:uncharacterized membrane protein